MQSIIACDSCGYERNSEADGRSFTEACAICYDENCPTPIPPLVTICSECAKDPATIIDNDDTSLLA